MKKYVISIFLLLEFVIGANATPNQLIDKNEISFSFTNCPVLYGWSFERNILLMNLNYDRRVSDYLSIGAYIGMGEYNEFLYSEREKTATTVLYKEHLKSLNIGSSIKLHVLPLFIESPVKWFDVFVKARLGAIYLPTSVEFKPLEDDDEEYIILPARGIYFDSSVMGGVTLYPTRRIGLFGEYGYRYFEYYKGFHSSFGISVRF